VSHRSGHRSDAQASVQREKKVAGEIVLLGRLKICLKAKRPPSDRNMMMGGTGQLRWPAQSQTLRYSWYFYHVHTYQSGVFAGSGEKVKLAVRSQTEPRRSDHGVLMPATCGLVHDKVCQRAADIGTYANSSEHQTSSQVFVLFGGPKNKNSDAVSCRLSVEMISV
jgi:hypothetical protein